MVLCRSLSRFLRSEQVILKVLAMGGGGTPGPFSIGIFIYKEGNGKIDQKINRAKRKYLQGNT